MDSGHQGGKAESCREQVMAAAERRWLFQQWWGADCGQDVIKNHSCTGGKTGRSGLPLGMQQARERFYLMYFTPEFCIGFNWEILCSEFCYDLPNWKSLWGFLGCWFLGKKKRHRPELWPAQPCPPSLWWSGATLCSQQEESWQGTAKGTVLRPASCAQHWGSSHTRAAQSIPSWPRRWYFCSETGLEPSRWHGSRAVWQPHLCPVSTQKSVPSASALCPGTRHAEIVI